MKKTIYTKQNEMFISLLVNARNMAELTQQAVADKLGKPQSFVAKYENGERRLDVVEFLQVAEVIETDPIALISQIRSKL